MLHPGQLLDLSILIYIVDHRFVFEVHRGPFLREVNVTGHLILDEPSRNSSAKGHCDPSWRIREPWDELLFSKRSLEQRVRCIILMLVTVYHKVTENCKKPGRHCGGRWRPQQTPWITRCRRHAPGSAGVAHRCSRMTGDIMFLVLKTFTRSGTTM